jgi:hypothetical protein
MSDDNEIDLHYTFTQDSTYIAGAVAVHAAPASLASQIFEDAGKPGTILSIMVSNCTDEKQFASHTVFSIDGLAYLQAYIEEHVRTWTPAQQARYTAKIDQYRKRCREVIGRDQAEGRRP